MRYRVLTVLMLAGCAGSQGQPATPLPAPARASSPTHYVLAPGAKQLTPVGCRSGNDANESWTFDVDRTPDKASITETVSQPGDKPPRVTEYACTVDGDDFACDVTKGYDYNQQHVAANVAVALSYKGRFVGADALEFNVLAKFTCAGDKCADLAPQWGVLQFPCEVSGAITGTATH